MKPLSVTELQYINEINNLKHENEELKAKIAVLSNKNMFENPISNAEEMICIEQIDLLKQKSSSRELSLDEVKRLDLLVKNLRLIREQSTEVINTTDYKNLGEAELVAIASSRDDG